MQAISIEVQKRDGLGKKSSKAIRRDGHIPAVVYGGGEPVHFTTTLSEIKNLVYTPEFKIADLSVDGTHYRCIVKDVQYHPVTDEILHIDFLRLVENHPVKVEVPVRFKGTSPGVRAGGKLQQLVRRIKIKAKPEDLVDALELDISKLELGQSIRVRDIEPIQGVEIINTPGTPVAIIEIPRALRSATAAAEKAGK